ncbi:hypothetical protein URH17368_2311 [Alicyclobacillus hesperidum URH17-3-68]|nr:hypothetical protein URH17368_2311 [Alicyclobacillus hesperidum URH17-3-68]
MYNHLQSMKVFTHTLHAPLVERMSIRFSNFPRSARKTVYLT